MVWVLLFLNMRYAGSHSYSYAGEYRSHAQCDAMADRINQISTRDDRYICVEVPKGEL